VFGLLDPLAIALRSYVLVVHACLVRGLSAIASAFGWRAGGRFLSAATGSQIEPVFALQAATTVVFVGLLALELVRRRFWCRYVCPLGALYALAGLASLATRSVSSACVECGLCADRCPMGCISGDGRRTLDSECTLCLDCQAVCPTGAVSFLRPTPREQVAEVDLSRRGVLIAAATGALAHPALRLSPSVRSARGGAVIRPPLAGRDTTGLLQKCLRCGQCMRVCPSNAIQPAGLQAGAESLWTPVLVPRIGYCVYECDACGRACPTGAIPPFSLAEKHRSAMGLAFVDHTRCIPWRGNQRRGEEGFSADKHNCGVCEEVCPVPGKAIHFRRVYSGDGGGRGGAGRGGAGQAASRSLGPGADRGELRLPYVRPEACIGCGFCEFACPVQGAAAIRVTGGYRELAESAQAVAEGGQAERALPAHAGQLSRVGPTTTYSGAEELFDYINGGAEPYITFGFVRVMAAEYVGAGGRLKADLWEFASSDDAFGAFAKDRQGESVAVGDEGAALGSSLWVWRGRFMLALIDMGGATPGHALTLGAEVVRLLDEPAADPPAIVRRLPAAGLVGNTAVFLRDSVPLYSISLADKWIPDDTFGLADEAVGAYGAYDLRTDGRRAGLLLVDHASEAAASESVERLVRVRSSWGDHVVASEPYVAIQSSSDDYCVVGASGSLMAAAFRAPSGAAGTSLVGAALQPGAAERR
jgi:ferredoxin